MKFYNLYNLMPTVLQSYMCNLLSYLNFDLFHVSPKTSYIYSITSYFASPDIGPFIVEKQKDS